MSGDQRPGRVRVISSGRRAEPPQRRRGDPAIEVPVAAMADATAPIAAEFAPTAGFSRLAMTLLFLIGCAMGGGLIAALGLFDMGVA